MKEFKTAEELMEFNQLVGDRYLEIMVDYLPYETVENIGKYPFNEVFGGNVFVVESPEDLREIRTVNRTSLAEAPAVFDICQWYFNFTFVEVFLATNNAGGNTYLIPDDIANNSENVLKSIGLTEEDQRCKSPELP
jgi:hypothetical protein